jgi:hypothetical protein
MRRRQHPLAPGRVAYGKSADLARSNGLRRCGQRPPNLAQTARRKYVCPWTVATDHLPTPATSVPGLRWFVVR